MEHQKMKIPKIILTVPTSVPPWPGRLHPWEPHSAPRVAAPYLQDSPRLGASPPEGGDHRGDVDHPSDRCPDGGREENLPGLGRVAQRPGQLHDRTEHGVVHLPGAAEEPEGRLALGD